MVEHHRPQPQAVSASFAPDSAGSATAILQPAPAGGEPPLVDHGDEGESPCDGIREYDNDLPRWWLLLLYGTIAWAAWYAFSYHVASDDLGPAQWRREDIIASEAKLAKAGPTLPEADLRKISHDPQRIAKGQVLYQKVGCATCHGPEGLGLVGPNLRDDLWIHGSDMAAIIETISKGRLDRGMPPQTVPPANLSPNDVVSVACYIADLNRTRKQEQGGKPVDPAREKPQRIDY